MVCEYCGGDAGDKLKLINDKVSCSACRVCVVRVGDRRFTVRCVEDPFAELEDTFVGQRPDLQPTVVVDINAIMRDIDARRAA